MFEKKFPDTHRDCGSYRKCDKFEWRENVNEKSLRVESRMEEMNNEIMRIMECDCQWMQENCFYYYYKVEVYNSKWIFCANNNFFFSLLENIVKNERETRKFMNCTGKKNSFHISSTCRLRTVRRTKLQNGMKIILEKPESRANPSKLPAKQSLFSGWRSSALVHTAHCWIGKVSRAAVKRKVLLPFILWRWNCICLSVNGGK